MNRLLAFVRSVLWWNVLGIVLLVSSIVAAVAVLWWPALLTLAIVLAIGSISSLILGLRN